MKSRVIGKSWEFTTPGIRAKFDYGWYPAEWWPLEKMKDPKDYSVSWLLIDELEFREA
jgi:hypothetical protein